jgi:hypothetical protein
MVKEVDEECNYLYSEKNNWYFVYTQLFKNILLWSAHPRMFGKEGFLGNHISIGELNGKLTIHETTHTSQVHPIGQYTIVLDKKSKWYKAHKNGSLVSSSAHAVGLWNDIAEEASKPTTGGMGLGVKKLIKKGKTPNQNIKPRLDKVKEYINNPEKYMVVVRVPYNSKDIIKEIRKYMVHEDCTAIFVTNEDSKTSFVMFNMEWPQ